MLIQDPEFMYRWWFRTHSLYMDVYSGHHSLCMDVDLGLHSLCMDVDSGNHSLCVDVDLGLQFMHRCWFREPQFMCGCWFRAPQIYMYWCWSREPQFMYGCCCVLNQGTTCHQCRQKTDDLKTICRNTQCAGVRGQVRWHDELLDVRFMLCLSSEIPLCVCVCVCVCMCAHPISFETYTRSTNIVPLSILWWEIVWWETIPFQDHFTAVFWLLFMADLGILLRTSVHVV